MKGLNKRGILGIKLIIEGRFYKCTLEEGKLKKYNTRPKHDPSFQKKFPNQMKT